MFITALFIIARTWKQPRCPPADKWIIKLWYIHTMEYYSAIKKNVFESVLMRWMKLEPVIHSEVSQKGKHYYSILMHIYGIQKDGNDDPICKTAKKRYKELCGRRQGWDNLREEHWNMFITICEIDWQSRFNAWDRVLRAGALGWPRGMESERRWEEGSEWGTHVHTWLINVNVCKKLLQYCKVIHLQLK